MTSSEYVTGWELRQVQVRHMSGAGTTTIRVPHAIRPGHTADEVPFEAACTAPVHQVSELPFPPTQSLASMNVACPLCSSME